VTEKTATQLRFVEPWAVVRLADNTPAVVTNTEKRGYRMVKTGRDRGRQVKKDELVTVVFYAAELAHQLLDTLAEAEYCWCGLPATHEGPACHHHFMQSQAEQRTELLTALQGLLNEPYGCTLCDSGKPRDPAKGHQPDCPYEAARAMIAKYQS
jgi:hypothetical protein